MREPRTDDQTPQSGSRKDAPASLTMRERLIKALYPFMARAGDFNDQGIDSYEEWLADEMGGPAHTTPDAIDALLAVLREPDDAMFNAGCAAKYDGDDPGVNYVFTAMIDHILQEITDDSDSN